MKFIIELFGRSHPLLLHLPIGALVVLAAVELRQRLGPGFEWSEGLRRFLIALTALFAVLAAAAGFVLGQSDSYVGNTIWWHRVLGIALAVCVTLSAGSLWCGRRRAYGFFLVLSLCLLGPVGHFGASMTHGANYLLGRPAEPGPVRDDKVRSERTPPKIAANDESSEPGSESPLEVSPAPSAEQNEPRAEQLDSELAEGASSDFVDYKTSIAPIFAAYCTDCHGPTKKKGGLALHIPQLILVGGSEGPVLQAGKPDESLLIKRLLLPQDDEDHMPPAGKPQPPQGSIEQIRTWIAAGAHI